MVGGGDRQSCKAFLSLTIRANLVEFDHVAAATQRTFKVKGSEVKVTNSQRNVMYQQ